MPLRHMTLSNHPILKDIWSTRCNRRLSSKATSNDKVERVVIEKIYSVTLNFPSTQNSLKPSWVVASALRSYKPSGTVCGVNGMGGGLTTA